MKQRHLLGLLFLGLGSVLALVALAAAREREWVVAVGAAVIGSWLLLTASGALRR